MGDCTTRVRKCHFAFSDALLWLGDAGPVLVLIMADLIIGDGCRLEGPCGRFHHFTLTHIESTAELTESCSLRVTN